MVFISNKGNKYAQIIKISYICKSEIIKRNHTYGINPETRPVN